MPVAMCGDRADDERKLFTKAVFITAIAEHLTGVDDRLDGSLHLIGIARHAREQFVEAQRSTDIAQHLQHACIDTRSLGDSGSASR